VTVDSSLAKTAGAKATKLVTMSAAVKFIAPYRATQPSLIPISKSLRDAAVRVLKADSYCRRDKLRMDAIVVLLAEEAKSIDILRRLIGNFRRKLSYEIAFTLFLLLWLNDWPIKKRARRRFQNLVEWYLMEAPRESGSACFEAAHLLASNWAGSDGIRIFKKLATSAQHQAGKEAAFQGFGFLDYNGKLSKRERGVVVALLSTIATTKRGRMASLAHSYLRDFESPADR
jgi:hypothetical protein